MTAEPLAQPGNLPGKRYRVLLAKPGLDGHNRGIHVVRRALIDGGFEVIYLGLRSTVEEVARAAVDENVDCVGLSVLSGAHLSLLPRVRSLMDEQGGHEIPLVVGGIIPDVDRQALTEQGVDAAFGPGTSLAEIVEIVGRLCRKTGEDEEEGG